MTVYVVMETSDDEVQYAMGRIFATREGAETYVAERRASKSARRNGWGAYVKAVAVEGAPAA